MADAAPVLPDLLAPGLRLVLCGSAVSAVSAKVRAPYAGPGNKFWPVLHEAGITPRRFQPSEWQRLLKLGIGLTDINKQESGADSALSAAADDPDALARKIEAYRPKWLAFTAKRPAQVFFRNTFGIRSKHSRRALMGAVFRSQDIGSRGITFFIRNKIGFNLDLYFLKGDALLDIKIIEITVIGIYHNPISGLLI